MKSIYKTLVITPIDHIKNVKENIKSYSKITILNDPSYTEVLRVISKYDALFTNPNKSKVFIDKKLITKAKNLKCITTASTGTNHIDIEFLKKKRIKLISLTQEYPTIRKITSTAEHALALTLAQTRNVIEAANSVKKNEWNYLNFIGRQISYLNVGVIGYGRLGKYYTKYCVALKSKVFIYDPYKKAKNKNIKQVKSVKEIFKKCDIISLHIHANSKNKNLINHSLLKFAKKELLLINTSRGEIVNEKDLLFFLKKNSKAKYATDVISNEIVGKKKNKLINMYKKNSQILITPHIGGMTHEAQEIAYNRVAKLMGAFMKNYDMSTRL
jgi:D-3-phosphoglycerate dehydrogenase / 2-oxoglutarate reductase